jgi:hypothetical protein
MKTNLIALAACGLLLTHAAMAAKMEPPASAPSTPEVKKPTGDGFKQTGKEGSQKGEPVKGKEASKGELDRAVLIEAGSEPRRVLRYVGKAGEGTKMISTMRQTFVKGPAGMPAMPGVEMEYIATVEKAESGAEGAGQFVMKREIAKVRVAEEDAGNPMAAAVGAMSAQLAGQVRTMTVSPVGKVSDVNRMAADGTAQPGAGDRTGLMSERMVAILPEEAVGVGAKWKVEQTQDIGGGRTPIEVTITVTKITVEGFEGDVAIARKGDEAAPAAGGMKIDSVMGTGKVKVQLRKPEASEASMVMEIKGSMANRRGGAAGGGEAQPVELKIETATRPLR